MEYGCYTRGFTTGFLAADSDALSFARHPFVAKEATNVPKPFLLGVEVEEIYVGPVMRAIKKLDGVVGVLDMDTQKKSGEEAAPRTNGAGQPRGPYNTRKQPVTLEETGDEAVIKALFGKPPMSVPQLRDLFVAQGRSGKSISSVLHKLKKQGDVQIGDDGYMLTKKARDRMRHRKGRKK